MMIGGFGNSQAYEVFWNGQRVGAMGEVDGGVWGLRMSIPKAIPVQGHGREAVVAIRLRAGGIPGVTRQGKSWIGTEAFIQERVEIWRGEGLRNNLPLLLISASLLLSAVLFLLLPLWRRDAPEYFWFGLWLLFSSIIRVCQTSPDVDVGLEGSLASLWIVRLLTAALGLSWLGWMRTLFLSRITQAVWLATAAIVALALGFGAFFTAGGNNTPLLSFSYNMLFASCLAFIYYQLGWRSSRETDRMPFIHIAILVYLAVLFAVYGAGFFSPTSAMATQQGLARAITGLLFPLVMTILMNQRSARLLVERERLSGELASAAEVQSLLLTSLPTAGDLYRIEPVYLPASEVGGDFYQVLERAGGSRIVLVGDVSGKGLKAAMLVSVTVGMMRIIDSSSPAKILAALNRGASWAAPAAASSPAAAPASMPTAQ